MIQINDLRLKKYDCLTWTIERRRITQDGTISWINLDYFPSLEIATRDLFFKSIHEPDSIAGLIKNIEHAKDAITSAIAGR